MRNALTFDVEDYFHVEAAAGSVSPGQWTGFAPRVADNTRRILDLLDTHSVSATFFVLGWVADRHGALVREIHARGHEVGCHSYAHRLVYSMGREEFRDDVRRAKAAIEDAAGTAIYGYRAPTFSVVEKSLWALDVLAEEGFEYDSSVFPIHHDRYGMPAAPRFPHRVRGRGGAIVEFPMTTVRLAGQRLPFCGGGYFRLLPYPVIRAGLRWINRHEGQPGIVYLHPWELDPDHPDLPIRGLTRRRHYVNIKGTARKLDRLLRDFAFGAARDVLRTRETEGAIR
jgi:polysaccharide deacetylase family protein (PEP-CTERM system associated)